MRIKAPPIKKEIEVQENMPLPELIHRLVSAYGKSPYDINNGDCDSFANALLVAAEQIGLSVECFDSYDEENFPVHYWVRINGRHYDAEAAEGVLEWHELPIFKAFLLKKTCLPIS
jgi:hypothetical protein